MLSITKDNRGVILVLTLIIMSILLATAISFAVFIISDIKQAKSIDDSIGAYYGADAGIERSLYQFRKQNVTSTISLTPSYNLASSSVDWSVAKSTDTEDIIVRQRLYNGQSVKLFFLNRSNNGANKAECISVVWKKGENSGNSNMLVTFTQLLPQIKDVDESLIYYTDQSKLEMVDSYEAGAVTPYAYNFKDILINSNGFKKTDYVVEMKALGIEGDYIENLKVQAYGQEDCTGNPINGSISNIAIISEGKKNQSVQQITAQIPPRDPVSGILSFVLFSEEDITKQ